VFAAIDACTATRDGKRNGGVSGGQMDASEMDASRQQTQAADVSYIAAVATAGGTRTKHSGALMYECVCMPRPVQRWPSSSQP